MSSYIHGTSPEEQKRLSMLNELLNQSALRELNLKEGDRILDVGCGLGQFTRGMARAVGPSGRVVGIERSPEQIAEALRQARENGEEKLFEMRQGNANSLPLRKEEWGSFDVAHARFLLEHIPDPLAAVRMMVEAARPGGRIVLQDDDHDLLRLWPEPEGCKALWEAYIRTYDRLGNDPYIGRKLAEILHRSGARPIRNTWLFFGSCAGRSDFLLYAENLISVLSGAREAMLVEPGLSEVIFNNGIHALNEWKKRSDSAIWYSVCWIEGVKP